MERHDRLVAWLRTLSPAQRARVHEQDWYLKLAEQGQDKVDIALDELSADEFRAGRSTEELVEQAGLEDELDEDFDLARDVYGDSVDTALAGDVYELDSLSAEEEGYE